MSCVRPRYIGVFYKYGLEGKFDCANRLIIHASFTLHNGVGLARKLNKSSLRPMYKRHTKSRRKLLIETPHVNHDSTGRDDHRLDFHKASGLALCSRYIPRTFEPAAFVACTVTCRSRRGSRPDLGFVHPQSSIRGSIASILEML